MNNGRRRIILSADISAPTSPCQGKKNGDVSVFQLWENRNVPIFETALFFLPQVAWILLGG
jgi:hypothetical protein